MNANLTPYKLGYYDGYWELPKDNPFPVNTQDYFFYEDGYDDGLNSFFESESQKDVETGD